MLALSTFRILLNAVWKFSTLFIYGLIIFYERIDISTVSKALAEGATAHSAGVSQRQQRALSRSEQEGDALGAVVRNIGRHQVYLRTQHMQLYHKGIGFIINIYYDY